MISTKTIISVISAVIKITQYATLSSLVISVIVFLCSMFRRLVKCSPAIDIMNLLILKASHVKPPVKRLSIKPSPSIFLHMHFLPESQQLHTHNIIATRKGIRQQSAIIMQILQSIIKVLS